MLNDIKVKIRIFLKILFYGDWQNKYFQKLNKY